MIPGKVVTDDNSCVVSQVWRTDGMRERMQGLLAWSRLDPDQGMWIEPCSSVHTMFMRYDLDLIYLDDKGLVKKIVANVRPWRISGCYDARATLELFPGALDEINLSVGQSLFWQASS